MQQAAEIIDIRRRESGPDDFVRDGETLRVPIFLMDSARRASADSAEERMRAQDAAMRDFFAFHRIGAYDAQTEAAVQKSHAERQARISNAWRGQRYAAPARDAAANQDDPDYDPVQASEDAYEARKQWVSNAWRDPNLTPGGIAHTSALEALQRQGMSPQRALAALEGLRRYGLSPGDVAK